MVPHTKIRFSNLNNIDHFPFHTRLLHCLRLAATEHPDVVVLDLGLPDMDGIDLLERLRQWSTAPVIILSVREQETQKVRALDAGADDYLTKPFGMSELMARIRVALRHQIQQATADPIIPHWRAGG